MTLDTTIETFVMAIRNFECIIEFIIDSKYLRSHLQWEIVNILELNKP